MHPPLRAFVALVSLVASTCFASAPPPAAPTPRRVALAAAQAGEWQQALDLLSPLVQATPQDPILRLAEARCFSQQGDRTRAVDSLTKAVAAGYAAPYRLRADPGFAPIAESVEFKSAVERAEQLMTAADEDLVAQLRERFKDGSQTVAWRPETRVLLLGDAPEAAQRQVAEHLEILLAAHRRGLFPHGVNRPLIVHVPALEKSPLGGVPPKYSPAGRTLTVNLLKGGGVTHAELVRALLDDDAKALGQAPAPWLAAGLPALYEQSRIFEGQYPRGIINRGLKTFAQALPAGKHLPLARLLAQTTLSSDELYTVEARYLLYWLQETDRLTAFYNQYQKDCFADPTGRQTLETVIGKPLAEIETDWLKFISELKQL